MNLLLALVVTGVLLALVLYVGLWRAARPADSNLERRLRRVAAVLSGEQLEDESVGSEVSVFRTRDIRSRLIERVEARFCLLDGAEAFPRAVAVGALTALVVGVVGLGMQFGSLVLPLVPAAWAGGGWTFLRIWDKRMRAQFVKQFPEVVDQVVRLARAGLPAVEAISAVANETHEPAKRVLRQVSDRLATGLEPEVVLREAAARVRIVEFTLFTATLALQRSTGGGIAAALGNLATTVRTRMEIEMKAHAATAETRITLWVLTAVPILALGGQAVTNPNSVAVLFATESGAMLLRAGVGLIVTGLLVARGIVASFGK